MNGVWLPLAQVSSSLYKPLPPMPAYDPNWSPPNKSDDKPAWDNSPMRSRPAALRGLKPVTPEPWAADEQVRVRVVRAWGGF